LTEMLPYYAELIRDDPALGNGSDESNAHLGMLFEERFGQFIVEKICKPYGFRQAGCLVAAVQACQVAHKEKA